MGGVFVFIPSYAPTHSYTHAFKHASLVLSVTPQSIDVAAWRARCSPRLPVLPGGTEMHRATPHTPAPTRIAYTPHRETPCYRGEEA